MSDPCTVDRLKERAGKEVLLRGWVRTTRRKGRIGFLVLRDGTGDVQCVAVRNEVGDELFDLLDFGKTIGAEVRFIEYMDVGGATRWSQERVFSKREMLAIIEDRAGAKATPIDLESWAPARRFRLPDGTTFGIIASTTEPFCRTCDRSRLTADGVFYSCLYAQKGLDLRAKLRTGASDEELEALLASSWRSREDRGAEIRLELAKRDALVEVDRLRKDPHLEMHTRGG